MNLNPQYINKDGKPSFVILPINEWNKILENIEHIEDYNLYNKVKSENKGFLPSEIIEKIVIHGLSPINVLREYRNMTQQELANEVGISQVYLSKLETGKRKGSIKVLKDIAQALNVDLELVT